MLAFGPLPPNWFRQLMRVLLTDLIDLGDLSLTQSETDTNWLRQS